MASAKQNDRDALFALGTLFESGDGVANKDLIKAFAYYTIAAAAGHRGGNLAARQIADMLNKSERGMGQNMAMNFKVKDDIEETEYD